MVVGNNRHDRRGGPVNRIWTGDWLAIAGDPSPFSDQMGQPRAIASAAA